MADCRIGDCNEPAVESYDWCALHLDMLRKDPGWVPILQVKGNSLLHVCALCRTPIWWLQRKDQADGSYWAIESNAHPDGRVEICKRGFVVLSPGIAAKTETPLFRAHGPVCTARAALLSRQGG